MNEYGKVRVGSEYAESTLWVKSVHVVDQRLHHSFFSIKVEILHQWKPLSTCKNWSIYNIIGIIFISYNSALLVKSQYALQNYTTIKVHDVRYKQSNDCT